MHLPWCAMDDADALYLRAIVKARSDQNLRAVIARHMSSRRAVEALGVVALALETGGGVAAAVAAVLAPSPTRKRRASQENVARRARSRVAACFRESTPESSDAVAFTGHGPACSTPCRREDGSTPSAREGGGEERKTEEAQEEERCTEGQAGERGRGAVCSPTSTAEAGALEPLTQWNIVFKVRFSGVGLASRKASYAWCGVSLIANVPCAGEGGRSAEDAGRGGAQAKR